MSAPISHPSLFSLENHLRPSLSAGYVACPGLFGILGFRLPSVPPVGQAGRVMPLQGRDVCLECGDPPVLTRSDSQMHSCWAVLAPHSVPYVLIRILNTTPSPFSPYIRSPCSYHCPSIPPASSSGYPKLHHSLRGLHLQPPLVQSLHCTITIHRSPLKQPSSTTSSHITNSVNMNFKPVQSKPQKPTDGQENIRGAASSNGAVLFA